MTHLSAEAKEGIERFKRYVTDAKVEMTEKSIKVTAKVSEPVSYMLLGRNWKHQDGVWTYEL